jgi:hypothetical protein
MQYRLINQPDLYVSVPLRYNTSELCSKEE